MTNLLESCRWDTSGTTVYIIGPDCQVQDTCSWPEAVTAYLEGLVSIFMSHPTRRVRSAGGTVDMAHPLIVQLRYWKTPKGGPKVRRLHDRASSKQILERDGRTCCYCGKKATTADHLKPRERCRRDGDPYEGTTWGNLVAACWDCNQRKKNRTPEEAGMTPRWQPFVQRGVHPAVQATVNQVLETGEGYHLEPDEVAGIIKRERKLRVVA